MCGPPRQLISSTRQEALKALNREYTIATETFEIPVKRLTQPIVGGAAKKNTRPARRISAYADPSSGSRRPRSTEGPLMTRATAIAAAGM